jgi:hypothetical protein
MDLLQILVKSCWFCEQCHGREWIELLCALVRSGYENSWQAFIPANRMPYAGMADAGDRADLLAYLLKATR